MILRGEAYLHLVEYQYPFIPEKKYKKLLQQSNWQQLSSKQQQQLQKKQAVTLTWQNAFTKG